MFPLRSEEPASKLVVHTEPVDVDRTVIASLELRVELSLGMRIVMEGPRFLNPDQTRISVVQPMGSRPVSTKRGKGHTEKLPTRFFTHAIDKSRTSG
jgi:hypothetical protein